MIDDTSIHKIYVFKFLLSLNITLFFAFLKVKEKCTTNFFFFFLISNVKKKKEKKNHFLPPHHGISVLSLGQEKFGYCELENML